MGHATILGALAVVAFATAGCVVHPDGEREERDRASAAGVAYARPFAERELPELPPDAPLATFVARAEAANGGLEAAWQRWRAALERVPQDGSQPTTAMVGLQHTLDGGAALDRTVLSVLSDAMRNVLWPGRVAAGSSCDAVAANIDFLPTFVKLAGGSVPTDRAIDGKDISSLLLGQSSTSPHEAFYYFNGIKLQAVRSGPWKLAIVPRPKEVQDEAAPFTPLLYNLDAEIGEQTNVAADHPDVVARLQQLVARMDADLGATGNGPGVRPPGRVEKPVGLWLPGQEPKATTADKVSQ